MPPPREIILAALPSTAPFSLPSHGFKEPWQCSGTVAKPARNFGSACATGKPEPLRGDLTRFWSRHIDREHRLVYRATPTTLEVLQCRHHG